MKKIKKSKSKKEILPFEFNSLSKNSLKMTSYLDKILIKTLKEFPKTVQHKKTVAKEKARIRKNFEKARFEIFGTKKKNIFG